MEVEVLIDLDKEPVSLKEAAHWCKVDAPLFLQENLVPLEADGNLTPIGQELKMLVTSAREWCEQYTGLAFGRKTFQVSVQRTDWRGVESLPNGPNRGLIKVLNANGEEIPTEQFTSTWYAEYLKGMSVNNTFKEDYGYFGSVDYTPFEETYTVEYTGGFAEGKLPQPLRHAILKIVAESYNNRDNTVIGTIVAELPMDARQWLNLYKSKVLF